MGDHPYFSDETAAPAFLVDEAAKSRKKLASRPANADEVSNYLKNHPTVTSYEQLLHILDGPPKGDVLAARISRFVNNNILRAKHITNALIARRDLGAVTVESANAPRD